MNALVRASFVGLIALVGCRRAPQPAVSSQRAEPAAAPAESPPEPEPVAPAPAPAVPENPPVAANPNPPPGPGPGVVDAGPPPTDGSSRFIGNETFRAVLQGSEAPSEAPHPGSLRILEAADGTHVRIFFADSDRAGVECAINGHRADAHATTVTIETGQQCVSTQRHNDTLTMSIDSGTLRFGPNGTLTADYHANLAMQSGTETVTGSVTYHFTGTRQ